MTQNLLDHGAEARFIVGFADDGCRRLDLVGGKGASLGRMTGADLPVPSGFVVTTAAYDEFVSRADLDPRIQKLAATSGDRSVSELEAAAREIEELIVSSEIPGEVAAEVLKAYGEFDHAYVAVRSSGTAEDLVDASFAGLHESYLDIRGTDAVLDAVRRCWASMWTARAIQYREQKGFDHSSVKLAVVVQTMVASEVAGVLFTGNPRTLRADEYVINASWGLGESVVLGKVTPDEYVVERDSARIKRRVLGSKQTRIDRALESAFGTIERQVPESTQAVFTLTDENVAELARLGTRVTEFYGGAPQDIEWGFADGGFALLQARPITGVEFTWDEDCEAWQTCPEPDEAIWTYSFASMGWNGAVTPLFYSLRAKEFTDGLYELCRGPWGFPDLAEERWFKFRRSALYFNTNVAERLAQYVYPSLFRPALLQDIAPPRHEAVLSSGFDVLKYLRFLLGVAVDAPDKNIYASFRSLHDYFDNRVDEANGLTSEELRHLPDDELEAHAKAMVSFAKGFIDYIWTPVYLISPSMFSALGTILQKWYRGTNPQVMQDLVSGLPHRTLQMEEDIVFWQLGEKVRESALLHDLINKHEGAEFFAACRDTDEGREFLEQYNERLLIPYGHRGHADRDIYFTRRSEDPAVDHRALRTFAKSDSAATSPEQAHERLASRRVAATEEVLADLKAQPLGAVKVEAFKLVLDWLHQLLVVRDNIRSYGDRFTFSKKRAYSEIGRRCVERGLLEGEEDFYFLSSEELLDVFHGRVEPSSHLRAKIAARSKVFHDSVNRDEVPPWYLVGDTPTAFDPETDDTGDVLKGSGIANGEATGRARVVRRLEDIGTIERGDVLICNSTDPGWTSVFALVRGVVIETGGMLAHAACLSREYGIPCVSLPGALRRIPDGAEIRIDGTVGEIRVLESASV